MADGVRVQRNFLASFYATTLIYFDVGDDNQMKETSSWDNSPRELLARGGGEVAFGLFAQQFSLRFVQS